MLTRRLVTSVVLVGGRGNFVNYQSLMVADDGLGVARSVLADEEHFRYLKTLHTKNLLVPVVGNVAQLPLVFDVKANKCE